MRVSLDILTARKPEVTGELTSLGAQRRQAPVSGTAASGGWRVRKPATGAEKSNPSKRHRDRLNAELDHLASLLPFPADVVSKLDKLSVLRLSVSYLRVKSFFQGRTRPAQPGRPALCSVGPAGRAACPGELYGPRGPSAVLEGRLLLETLDGFALVVSAEGVIFYASATIADHLGFHQVSAASRSGSRLRTLTVTSPDPAFLITECGGLRTPGRGAAVAGVFLEIPVRSLGLPEKPWLPSAQKGCPWVRDPSKPPDGGLALQTEQAGGEDAVLGRLLRAQAGAAGPTEFAAFLTRCFTCRVRCLLDSTSGFLLSRGFVMESALASVSRRARPPQAQQQRRPVAGFCHRRPAKATRSLCESELHGKPSFLAGRSNRERGVSVLRAQVDACRWARAPARATCLCLRGGPDLVLGPEGAAGDRAAGEHGRARRETHTYDCRFQTPEPARHLSWVTGKRGQDGARLKLEPSRGEPFPTHAAPRGSCLSSPGGLGTVPAFRNPPSCHQAPSAFPSRASRALRDGGQGQAHPPTSCPFPQGGLENRLPQPSVQRLAVGGYSTEDIKVRSVPMPPGAPCNPMFSLNVPIKMESDSGSENAPDGYCMPPSQMWLGASDMAKRQLVTFPTRMHLKTEPDSGHHLYSPHLGPGMLGAPPRPGRELTPGHPSLCVCLEPPPCLCMRGHQPPTLGRDCRAPGTTSMVKREPLDSPPWAAHSQGGVHRMLPKSALATLMPPTASEGTFLP
ncbi:aryl hydrocarbon receptor repressor [Pteropus vampyrus]|uniref:Aryl hydrocarbon receptor repressor n=1 Tax=Pteropus vampyrus TaxID=132908 RepID=A0A6P6BKC6_PTEVA|nr:aryl hydrocarbon receptor repressor [Pteropus vampyrus]